MATETTQTEDSQAFKCCTLFFITDYNFLKNLTQSFSDICHGFS